MINDKYHTNDKYQVMNWNKFYYRFLKSDSCGVTMLKAISVDMRNKAI